MKFNPDNWSKIKDGEVHETKSGLLRLMCAEKALVYITVDGVEALAAAGEGAHKIEVLRPFSFRVVSEGEIWLFSPVAQTFKPTGEVFTNADRMVLESGNLLEVKRAMREWQLEQREMVRNMRAETRKLVEAQKKAAPKPQPKEDEPDDTPDETDEGKAEE